MARRAFRVSWPRLIQCGMVTVCLLGAVAFGQQIQANIDFSNISQMDPHPITYSWSGENKPVVDPGPFYYNFFYTGTVNPDARVAKSDKIQRVAIPLPEWEANRNWIISKLELYYRLSHNLRPDKAIRGLTGEPEPTPTPTPTPAGQQFDADGNPIGGDQGTGQEGGEGQQQPPTPNPMMMMPGMMMPMPGMVPGMMPMPGQPGAAEGTEGGANTPMGFDPKAAAEWTFYYDQLVLWQYFCVRNLLNSDDDSLIDKQDAEAAMSLLNSESNQTNPEYNSTTDRARRNPTMLDLAATVQPGQSGQDTLQLMKDQTRPNTAQGTMGGGMAGGMPSMAMPMMGGGMMGGGMMGGGMMGGMMGMGMSGGMGGENGTMVTVREQFFPQEDYNNPDRVKSYREKFTKASERKEADLHKAFLAMIGRIDDREVNQTAYRQEITRQQQDVQKFAENWRNVQNGDTFKVGNTLYMATEKPMDAVPLDTVNIDKKARRTPQDLLNEDGSFKQPKE